MMQLSAFLGSVPGKGEQARQRLLQAALGLFAEKGREGASVREIAKAAGQNVAAIAYYFGGKDQLYGAVMEGIVREMQHRLADVLAEAETLRRTHAGPQDAARLLKLFLSSVFVRLVSRDEAVAIARLIVREQLQPTSGFEILYEQGFRRLHEALCFLVGTALGRNPSDPNILIRTHAIMGQVYFFAMARQGILRRLGWRSFEGKNAETVAQVIAEHIDVLVSGLAAKPGGAATPAPVR